jgi:hypothetical protein
MLLGHADPRVVRAVADLVTRGASDELVRQMDAAIQEHSEAIHQAEARQSLARGALQKLPGVRLQMDAFRASLASMAERLLSADLPTQRRLLSSLLSQIEIDPDHHLARVHIKRFAFDQETLAALPDGRLLSSSFDHTLKVWDERVLAVRGGVEADTCAATLAGHTDNVIALAVLPDRRVVSGGFDATLRVWG